LARCCLTFEGRLDLSTTDFFGAAQAMSNGVELPSAKEPFRIRCPDELSHFRAI